MQVSALSKPRGLEQPPHCAYGVKLVSMCILFVLLCVSATRALAQGQTPLYIQVLGPDAQALAGASIQIEVQGKVISTITADAQGRAAAQCNVPHFCAIVVSLPGYKDVRTQIRSKGAPDVALTIELPRSIQHTEAITVQAEGDSPLATSQSSEFKLPVAEATESPLRPASLIDALPLVPGVVRTPDGRVSIAGLGEQHSALIVNSVDVTDPATGDFGLSVPIDSVDNVKVLQSPYLAQYGNFTAGVVSAETRRGGDKWLYGVDDPLPEVRIRSGHLVGIRSATPRFNLSGPLIPHRLYFLDGTDFLMHKDQVRTLPFSASETRSTVLNSFTELDEMLTGTQTLTATLHFAPHTIRYANLNYFDPQPVTPNADYQEDTGSVTHRLGLGGGLLSTTVASTRVATNVQPQTSGEMTLTPLGNSGSYFSDQSVQGTRSQWIETWTPRLVNWGGQHSFQMGSVLAYAEDNGKLLARGVNIRDKDGHLLQTITYSGESRYQVSDVEPAVYAQDHWVLDRRFAIDAGLRLEMQSLTATRRLAPRAGFAWTPTKNAQTTVIRGGMGVFYDQVPLNTYTFRSFPQQTVTTYDGYGNVTEGPRLFYNLTTTQPESRFPFLDQKSQTGDFAPYSLAWNIEAEQMLWHSASFRIRYSQADANNQLTLQSQSTPDRSALVLGGSGAGQTKRLDVTAVAGPDNEHRLYFSYSRESARGVLTEVDHYLGNFRFPVVRSLALASTAGEIPNRFLFWGTWRFPWRLSLSPHIEYRNGFPYEAVNQFQQYVLHQTGLQPRYPNYLSLDARIAKDINISPKHAVRFSVSGLNLSNHSNYLQVHNNIGDPQFGSFFGNYNRHFTVDFDFLF